jgi:hypothetical protein
MACIAGDGSHKILGTLFSVGTAALVLGGIVEKSTPRTESVRSELAQEGICRVHEMPLLGAVLVVIDVIIEVPPGRITRHRIRIHVSESFSLENVCRILGR